MVGAWSDRVKQQFGRTPFLIGGALGTAAGTWSLPSMLNTFQQAPHPMLPKATHDEASRQEFVKSFKGFIQSTLLPGLNPIYETRVSQAFKREHGRVPQDRREIRQGMVKDPYFRLYAAHNRIA